MVTEMTADTIAVHIQYQVLVPGTVQACTSHIVARYWLKQPGTPSTVFSLDIATVPVPEKNWRYIISDVISVNRRMCKCTVVGTVTTFSVGRRTDVNGGAGSGFSMMISHGVMVKVVVVQVGLM